MSFVSCASSFNSEKIDTLKEQQKVLKMTTELNKLQLDYEKEKANKYRTQQEKQQISNVEAKYSYKQNSTQLTHQTLLRMQKSTIKRLKEAKAINKKLAKSQKTLTKMEKKIAKLQAKIDDCNKRIKFVNN